MNQDTSQRQTKKLSRFLRDIAVGAILVPTGLVVFAGVIAYIMYLLF